MTKLKIQLLIGAGIACCSLAHATPFKIESKDIPNVEIDKLIPHMTPMEGTTPTQWRVVWTGDASREATISWSTKDPGSKHRVLYGTNPNQLNETQECQRSGAYQLSNKDKPETAAHYHHARLTGLKPDTNYHFVMESDGERSRTLYFRTAPASGTDFTIIHGGDSRSGHLNRARMNLRIASMASEDKSLLAFAHGGDYIVNGGIWSQWRLWASQHELTTTPNGRVLPIIPTYGNHDKGSIYYDLFDLDPDTETWHTTRIGKDVALITLSTNSPAGGDQAEWLEKQLSELRPQTRWLLVQYHRPMYPAVKEPAKHAPIFCPLFDKYNIDIALESDGHCMKRTVPIRDGKKDPTGIIYVGEGGLGVGQRKTKNDRWYLQDGGKAGSAHHVMRLDLTNDSLRCRFILMDNSTWDDITIKPR